MERSPQYRDIGVLSLFQLTGDEFYVSEDLFVLPCALGYGVGNAERGVGSIAGGLNVEGYLVAALLEGNVPVPRYGSDAVELVRPFYDTAGSVIAPFGVGSVV